MKKSTPSSKTAGKVVFGFLFAAIFLIGITGLTYYTLKRLLRSMDELMQPSEKLDLLNELQVEIIQITYINRPGIADDFRIKPSSINSIHQKLTELATLAEDSAEAADIQSIRVNLDMLITGYSDLYDVKSKLANRNFTQEALRKVELGIRRRASNAEIQSLAQLSPKEYIFNELEQQNASRQELQTNRISGDIDKQITHEENKLITYLKDLQQQNVRGNGRMQTLTLDSILYNIRGVINRIYREEAYQRQRLATLESRLSKDQSLVISTIQQLVATLQKRALEESRQTNLSALGMTKEMIIFILTLVALAIIGSILMGHSILQEIKVTRNYQDKLEASRLKSEQLARSKQEFLANMSHEIRNPLHVIQGYRSVLEKSNLDSGQQSHLRMIGFASDTLMEIVDEVLDFSKLEAGKLKLEAHPFDPESLFSSIQNFFELQASEKKLDFDWSLDLPPDKWLTGDQLRLKQILNNLLSNAFKFTPHGSIRVNVWWGDDVLHVEIRDTGIGMSPEVLEKVFREFDQADTSISRKYGGTGLGLAIVQRLVSLMGGEIQVESEEAKGTTMKVGLPMMPVDPERTAYNADEIESLDLTGIKILLVDDDKVGVRYLETILSYFGATIIAYPGGVDFRDEFVEVDFDLAILDIQMPEFSGFDVVKKLRSFPHYQDLPVLAMTANVFVEDREKMLENGFSDILFKPFQEKVLLECLGKFFPDHVVKRKEASGTFSKPESGLFELKDLAKFCMGDELLLQDIVRELIVETQKDLDLLKQSRHHDDFDQILGICHQLGSRLGQIKSPSGQVARKIENSIKLGKKNGLGDALNQLDKEVRILLSALTGAIENSTINVMD